MAERFVNVDRQTPMLLPADLREWVADNELAHLILEAVEQCDLRAARVNVRGSGSEQYPPTMMLALLIYAYATGVFSSRRIERASYESVAERYLCANHHPDHDTIASFRRENQALFRSCFAQVLLLAREMGVLRVGAVSVDGTRMAGAGSKGAVRRLEEIERELERLGGDLLQEAEAADAQDRDGEKERNYPRSCVIGSSGGRSCWQPRRGFWRVDKRRVKRVDRISRGAGAEVRRRV